MSAVTSETDICHVDPRKKRSCDSVAPEEVASGLAPPTTNQRVNQLHILAM